MAASSVTNTGLNTINMSALSLWQLIILYLSSVAGSHITISDIIVHIRKHYFSIRFTEILIFNKKRQTLETNRRKFENGLVDQHASKIKRRFSFLSTRSTPNVEQVDATPTPPTFRFSMPRPLSFARKHRRITESLSLDDIYHYPDNFDCHSSLVMSSGHPTRCNSISTLPLSTSSSTLIENNTPSTAHHRSSVHSLDISHISCQPPVTPNIHATIPNITSIDNRSSEIAGLGLSPIIQNSGSCPFFNTIHIDQTKEKLPRIDTTLSSNQSPTTPGINNDSSFTKSDDDDDKPHTAQAISFPANMDEQLQKARQRVQDQKFEETLQKIADNTEPLPTVLLDAETEDEEMKRIMREPVNENELTREQRYHLGGAEYRALDFLSRLVPCYYIFFNVGFAFMIRIYVAVSKYAQAVLLSSNTNGPVNPWVFSFFTSMSAFNNLGLLPLDANMVPFQSASFLPIVNMILILAGNTAYALFLRLIIWIMYKVTPKQYVMKRETYRYLLDHPRRCYTTLFPFTQTMWLCVILVLITAGEFVAFVALNYWLPVLDGISNGARILDGLFQSIATRSAGFSIVDLMYVNPATQVVFVVAMYLSVYPVAISMRNSNVYQERDLGIYSGQEEDIDIESCEIHQLKRYPTMSSIVTTSKKVFRKPDFYVRMQIQRQLSSEIFWLICCIFAVCVIEAKPIMLSSPITMSSVIYECVSAFANVGASTGFPNTSTSQSAEYQPLSKLVVILLMYKGRHRGLPSAIDRAVLLPSEQLEEQDREEQLIKRRRSLNNGVLVYNRSQTM